MPGFPTNAYLFAAASGLVVTWLSLPVWRGWCQEAGLVDDPGRRKIHDRPIPLAGGLGVFTGLLAPVLFAVLALELRWLDEETVLKLSHGLGKRAPQLLAIFCGAAGMVLLGWLDDRHELRAVVKLGGQLVIALGIAMAGVRITLFVDSALFSIAVTVLWILTVTNAINIMDNMNGLCAGLGAIGAGWFAASSIHHGHYLVALLAITTAAALLGFLPYNFPRASVFLGDSGSHLVGYLLAVLAILPHFYTQQHPHPWAVLTPVLVLAVPLADLAWVICLRWQSDKPIYLGDTNHLSHRLVRRGLSQPQAVVVIWMLTFLSGAGSLLFW
jgi:UDP-GlcNAc:undecaprenyl-phosphate GlcNAc-1-phosphate transferase